MNEPTELITENQTTQGGLEVSYCPVCNRTELGYIYYIEKGYIWKCGCCGEEVPCQPPMDMLEEESDE